MASYFSKDLSYQFGEGLSPRPKFFSKKNIFYVIAALLFLFLFYYFFLSAPKDFPKGTIVNIEENIGLRNLSARLSNNHIIRSKTFFEAFVITNNGEHHLIPGDYYFESSLPVYEVARRISEGDKHLAPVKVTIPEGFNVKDIAETFASRLSGFNIVEFLKQATPREGYLFPDTYFFLTTDKEDKVIKSMTDNYEKKILPIRKDIASSHHSEKEIITMASLIEGEAKGDADRAKISGILWKRISIGMALEVDAAPETYKTKGLPKYPISNPGLLAIKAAISPEKSSYLYYLHDKDGNIHYASTFAEHVANKLKYLK